MESELIGVQHTCKGLLKFILPKDTVTVDMEVMTLTGVHIYRKDRNSVEKCFFPWSEENMPPPEFLRKVRETQGQRTRLFTITFKPGFRAQFLAKVSMQMSQLSKLASTCKPSKPGSSQERHHTTPDNIPITVGMMQAQNGPENNKHKRK